MTAGALTTFDSAVPATQFTNIGSIANTRQPDPSTAAEAFPDMDRYRNDYGEVCVAILLGSQTLPQMPLWNRTIKATTYTTYTSSSLTQTVSQPGNNSLTCLSCHDGQTAVDSIINMPGSGNYQASQATTQNLAFLDAWTNPGGHTDADRHMGLNSTDRLSTGYTLGDGLGTSAGCLVCHSTTGVLAGATDFATFYIGTDLTNDHPVGITFPAATGAGTDWNTPGGTKGTSLYFDVNTNTKMDKDEIRIYSGQVECGSCHDPHGVPDPPTATSSNRPSCGWPTPAARCA